MIFGSDRLDVSDVVTSGTPVVVVVVVVGLVVVDEGGCVTGLSTITFLIVTKMGVSVFEVVDVEDVVKVVSSGVCGGCNVVVSVSTGTTTEIVSFAIAGGEAHSHSEHPSSDLAKSNLQAMSQSPDSGQKCVSVKSQTGQHSFGKYFTRGHDNDLHTLFTHFELPFKH